VYCVKRFGNLTYRGVLLTNKKLPYASSYKELSAYIEAKELADQIFHLSVNFPKEETYALIDQIRRSSRSIGAQIAEAWGKRRYIKHFVSKLTDAYAETYETEHWISIANQCGYWDEETSQTLLKACVRICQLIGGMISKAHHFCD
jgi:four helix bundle protein